MYDFPASPSTGQVYAGWSWDGEKWLAIAAVPNTSGVIAIKVFTASGSYVPSPSMTSCVVEVRGSGGGGGGVNQSASNSGAAGAGGGQGSLSRSTLTAAQVGASQAITIGNAGSGGAAGSNNGTSGADCSFGALVLAKGGGGGGYSANGGQNGSGGLGGVVGTGDFCEPGISGDCGALVTVTTNVVKGGFGGGAGGGPGFISGPGAAATGYGAGGAGGSQTGSSTGTQPGGNGSKGYTSVTEYGMTALAAGAAQGNVRYDLPQGLTSNQMAQARSNTGTPNANSLINGDFRINQGGYVSAAVLAAAAYGHDQWKAGAGGGDYSFTQLASSTQITIAAGKSLIQPIEDVRVVGGSYVLSWTGTAQARAGVNTLTPSGSYAASPLLISGQTAGTVMSVEFNTGTLGTVKLESGSIATPFMMPDYISELTACQRYWRKLGGGVALNFLLNGVATAAGQAFSVVVPHAMRATPTWVQVGAFTNTNCGPATFAASPDTTSVYVGSSAAGLVQYYSNSGSYLSVNARL